MFGNTLCHYAGPGGVRRGLIWVDGVTAGKKRNGKVIIAEGLYLPYGQVAKVEYIADESAEPIVWNNPRTISPVVFFAGGVRFPSWGNFDNETNTPQTGAAAIYSYSLSRFWHPSSNKGGWQLWVYDNTVVPPVWVTSGPSSTFSPVITLGSYVPQGCLLWGGSDWLNAAPVFAETMTRALALHNPDSVSSYGYSRLIWGRGIFGDDYVGDIVLRGISDSTFSMCYNPNTGSQPITGWRLVDEVIISTRRNNALYTYNGFFRITLKQVIINDDFIQLDTE